MSALDKLNAKANIVKTEEPEKKPVTDKPSKEKKTTQTPKKKAAVTKKTVTKEEKKGPDTKVTNKHPGGRTNTRGTAGKDYKMMNIAVPIDIYEKLKEASNGNMTFYINSLLKNSVEQ